jgi:4-methylaminobutanoate oxidase (formaldehyde-forming)
VYTQWLNEQGTIEADLTVTRVAEDRYLVVTAAATQVRDFAWLRNHIPSDARCMVEDVTSSMAVLSVMGPQSRELLQPLTLADLGTDVFPFGTSRVIDLGYAQVRASRITYVGELGWELYVPTEFATGVFDVLIEAGEGVGLALCGYHALNSLRLEKAYRHWGHDISPDDTPLEAGLGFAVAWDKPGGFTGRDALLQQREAGVSRRLVQVRVADDDALLYHNEPIWRDGQMVGHTTSGMYGHTLGAPLGLGYIENHDGVADRSFVEAGEYEVEVACERVPATVSLQPLYDPRSERIRA